MAVAFVAASCGGSTAPNEDLAVSCAGKTDATKVLINDLGAGCYLSFQGGLYPGGSNQLPTSHLGAGVAAAARIQPLNVNGGPDPTGKFVLLSIGMSNTTQEFCSTGGQPGSCESTSFIAQATTTRL